jgi:hypothetical protein
VGEAPGATLTVAALEQRPYSNRGSLGDILDPRTNLIHHSSELVPKDKWIRVREPVSEVHMEVATAYPVVSDLNTHLTLTCCGLRYFFETNVL